jgi:hypothetical protein
MYTIKHLTCREVEYEPELVTISSAMLQQSIEWRVHDTGFGCTNLITIKIKERFYIFEDSGFTLMGTNFISGEHQSC